MVNLPEKSADRRLRKTTGSLGLEEELDLSEVERGFPSSPCRPRGKFTTVRIQLNEEIDLKEIRVR